MAKVAAYRKDTGEKVYIPEHWIGHRTLGKPFSKTPRQKAEDARKTDKAPAAGDTEGK